ncbi:MAG: DUF11 domain-containing protein [Clostridia bacterium]|nr:DUF11 domain-containing protein [Clostridia bacterium]
MAIIENFATVRYTVGGVTETAVSNLAEVALESSVSLTKVPLGSTYGDDSVLTYILTVQNTSGAPLAGVRIEDNLGTFLFGTMELTPLTYGDNAILLIDGQDSTSQLTVDSSEPSSLVFTVPMLAAGATANIVYNAVVNEFAPLEVDSTIINTATLSADTECAEGTASATVTAESGANVSVFKQMSPNPVICGDTLTYTIRIFNYGNTAAEDVQLSDAFDPAPANITVIRNGVPVPATDYTYENGVLTVPADTADGDTVPAATFIRDPETGIVSVTPGMIEYVITGTI